MRYSRPSGKFFDKLLHRGLHAVGRGQRVRAGPLRDRHRHRRLIVEIAVDRVVAGRQLDPRDVADADDPAILAGLDDDLLELLGLEQSAERVDRELKVLARRARAAGR